MIPAEPLEVTRVSPRRLLIYSVPKKGKTSTVLKLPDVVHLDLEGGAEGFYKGRIVTIRSYSDLVEFFKEASSTDFHVRFLVLDTVSKLEELAKDYALILYKKTGVGKNFNGTDVTTLPNGAGYLYLRDAVIKLIDKLQTYCDTLILLGHIKYTYLNESEGEEIVVKELSLTGKLKEIVMAAADAIAFMYTGEDSNERYLSFVSDNNTVSGTRCEHVSNRKILISKKTEEGLETYWEEIFPEIKDN